jgi:hypothetical protein
MCGHSENWEHGPEDFRKDKPLQSLFTKAMFWLHAAGWSIATLGKTEKPSESLLFR